MHFPKRFVHFNRLQTRHFFRRVRLNIHRHPILAALSAGLLFVIYMIYHIFSEPPLNSHDHYDMRLTSSNKCSLMDNATQIAFKTFVQRIISVFSLLEVKHFLCYESLWTALKQTAKTPKPKNLHISDACFNLCVLNEDLVKHEEALIIRRFVNNGILINYYHSDGIYVMKPTTKLFDFVDKTDQYALHPDLFSIHARVHVFEKDSSQDMYRKVGWKSRILPPTMCNHLHCFPTNLIEGKALSQLSLLPSLEINVPHEGIEIQKYHYPDSWWTMTNMFDEECS